jgi:REP element-mobilizing transposase RayT
MPRQARLDTPGTLHHVMMRGIERKRIFREEEDRKDFVSRLKNLSQETGTRLLAWSLLNTHVHLLLFSGPSGLSLFMRRLLSGYSQAFNRRHKRNGHLFQKGSGPEGDAVSTCKKERDFDKRGCREDMPRGGGRREGVAFRRSGSESFQRAGESGLAIKPGIRNSDGRDRASCRGLYLSHCQCHSKN